jgi:hypothetical protein
MKLTFPTAPTAPAARRKSSDERPNQKNRHLLAIGVHRCALAQPGREVSAHESFRLAGRRGSNPRPLARDRSEV